MKLAHVMTESGPVLAVNVGEDLIDLAGYLRAASRRGARDAERAAMFSVLDAARASGDPALCVALNREAFSGLVAGMGSAGRDALAPHLVKECRHYLPPVAHPEKIIAIGRNYLAHALEGSGGVPQEVLFFSKAPSCLVGSGEPILAPEWAGRIDPEGELAVIMGKSGRYIEKDRAMDYVLGYSIINDVTAREMQHHDIRAGEPWFRSKSFDTFGPLGPFLVTADEVPDPHSLDIKTLVGGEVRQSDNTRSLMFKIPDIIAHISRFVTLKPGDVIATGTPEGMKAVFPGDTVEITIAGLGTLTNKLVKE